MRQSEGSLGFFCSTIRGTLSAHEILPEIVEAGNQLFQDRYPPLLEPSAVLDMTRPVKHPARQLDISMSQTFSLKT